VYGLKDDADVMFLLDRELLQVRIGKYNIELCFDGDVAIDVECKISLDEADRISGLRAATALLTLIGSRIRKLRIPGDGDLVLEFDEGPSLTLHDSNRNFESYQLRGPAKHVIV
jgi:hypothetical protein